MRIVYALASTIAGYPFRDRHETVNVREGEAFDADHPVVKANPDLFAVKPRRVRTAAGLVETATAEPGSKRSVRRG